MCGTGFASHSAMRLGRLFAVRGLITHGYMRWPHTRPPEPYLDNSSRTRSSRSRVKRIPLFIQQTKLRVRSMSMEDTQSLLRNLDPTVWIVTSKADARRGGLIATWVNESSLDAQAPRMMLGLAPHHFTTELIRQSGRLILHQITAGQMEHYWSFCLDKGREVDKFHGLSMHEDSFGLPRLDPCIGYLSCQVFAQVDAGDRVYLWCDVLESEQYSDAAPLTQSRLIQMAGEDRLKHLRKDRELDAERLRLPFRRWREALPPPGGPSIVAYRPPQS